MADIAPMVLRVIQWAENNGACLPAMEHQLTYILLFPHAAIDAIALIRLDRGFPTDPGKILFENHWAIWAAMCLVGVAASWRGINTQRAIVRNAGVVVLAATFIWVATAWMVVTPHERLLNANDAVVSAAGQDDVPKFMRYVSRRAIFGHWNYAQIQSGLTVRLKSAHITDNIIRSMTVRITANQAITRLVVWTSTRDYGPIVTSWRLVWQDHHRPGNWRIIQVELISLNGHHLPPDAGIPMPR